MIKRELFIEGNETKDGNKKKEEVMIHQKQKRRNSKVSQDLDYIKELTS